MKKKIAICFVLLGMVSFSNLFAQAAYQTYFPTKNRFQNFNELRTIMINNKPLRLDPFEMFDIMTFKEVGSGLNTYLMFTIPETSEEFYFNDIHNQFTYNGDFNTEYRWTGNQAVVTLECATEENLTRYLSKNKKYKVIYGYYLDSKLARKPFPTESIDGYYIVDIIEMYDQFEREKE
jgi:hypothetical protein